MSKLHKSKRKIFKRIKLKNTMQESISAEDGRCKEKYKEKIKIRMLFDDTLFFVFLILSSQNLSDFLLLFSILLPFVY